MGVGRWGVYLCDKDLVEAVQPNDLPPLNTACSLRPTGYWKVIGCQHTHTHTHTHTSDRTNKDPLEGHRSGDCQSSRLRTKLWSLHLVCASRRHARERQHCTDLRRGFVAAVMVWVWSIRVHSHNTNENDNHGTDNNTDSRGAGHFSCETRDDHGGGGSICSRATENGPAFCEWFRVCMYTKAFLVRSVEIRERAGEWVSPD